MTIQQKQCLLTYLGYDTGGVDGIWGTMSTVACREFQADYGLTADGICGQMTQKMLIGAIAGTAVKVERPDVDDGSNRVYAAEYLQADGYYHVPRGVDVQLSRNLWAHEVHCQGNGCCTESVVSKRMVDTFQAIRDDYGESIEIATAGGSGFRCRAHNASVKGSGTSLHLTGDAFDLHCRDKARLLPIVEKHVTDGEIGTYDWGIHSGVWKRGYVNRFSG